MLISVVVGLLECKLACVTPEGMDGKYNGAGGIEIIAAKGQICTEMWWFQRSLAGRTLCDIISAKR